MECDDRNVAMTVRIIDLSSLRYLQEGAILSIDDKFCGGYDFVFGWSMQK